MSARFAMILWATVFFVPSAFPAEAPPKWLGRAVPLFTATDLDGREVRLADALGTGGGIVVLNFWGVRCQACIEEMPFLGDISEKLGSAGVRVFGVNTDALPAAKIREILPEIGVNARHTILCDPEFKVMDAYQVTAAPYTLVIRPDGKAAYEHIGFAPGDEKELEAAIRKLLDIPGR